MIDINGETGNIGISSNSSTNGVFFQNPKAIPVQIGKDLIVPETTVYTVTENERFDDVFETNNIHPTIHWPEIEGGDYNIHADGDYMQNSIKGANTRHGSLYQLWMQGLYNILTAQEKANNDAPKGDQGDQGDRGLKGAKGLTGAVGHMGPDGAEGTAYDPQKHIWLNIDQKDTSFCATESEMTSGSTMYGSDTWNYQDVIEGLCSTPNAYKYFQDKSKSCKKKSNGQNGFETEVYQCQKAMYRLEPQSFNIKPIFSVCVYRDGDIPVDDLSEFKSHTAEFQSSSKVRAIAPVNFNSACSNNGDLYYSSEYINEDTPDINEDTPESGSVKLTLPSFKSFIDDFNTDVDGLSREPNGCASNLTYQVLRCESSGVSESNYKTHPSGFLDQPEFNYLK